MTRLALVGPVLVAYMNIVRTVDSHELRLEGIEKQVGTFASFKNQVLIDADHDPGRHRHAEGAVEGAIGKVGGRSYDRG